MKSRRYPYLQPSLSTPSPSHRPTYHHLYSEPLTNLTRRERERKINGLVCPKKKMIMGLGLLLHEEVGSPDPVELILLFEQRQKINNFSVRRILDWGCVFVDLMLVGRVRLALTHIITSRRVGCFSSHTRDLSQTGVGDSIAILEDISVGHRWPICKRVLCCLLAIGVKVVLQTTYIPP